MKITANKAANLKALAWAIRQTAGINCGAYDETGGVPETGTVGWRSDVGIVVTVPDDTPPSVVAQIEAVLAAHDATAPLPPDFPPRAAPVIETAWVDAYLSKVTDADRLQVLFYYLRYGAAYFVEPQL